MKQTVYLDNAATTRVRPEVNEAIAPFLSGDGFGNPSSSHAPGRLAAAAVAEARNRIAEALGTEPNQVVFTSGGTEADNLAVLGAARQAQSVSGRARVAVCALEHKAVLDSANMVARHGGEIVKLPVDETGSLQIDALVEALSGGLSLASVMWVNNETGSVQNVPAIAEKCAEAGTVFHTDAVQAVGKIDLSLADLPGTMVTISGHKIGAPKGIGALILAKGQRLEPMIFGGGQQSGIRPGTENVIGIVALGVAVQLAVAELREVSRRMGEMRNELEQRVVASIPRASVNGAAGNRAPHISNISFPGTRNDALLMHLDLAQVFCSSGSACNTGVASPSHVLSAMGIPGEMARAAVRFSFSHENEPSDVDRALEVLPDIVHRVRAKNEGDY